MNAVICCSIMVNFVRLLMYFDAYPGSNYFYEGNPTV